MAQEDRQTRAPPGDSRSTPERPGRPPSPEEPGVGPERGLDRISADLQSLVEGTDIAVLDLDRDLRIARFNARAAEVFGLSAADRGRRISEVQERVLDGAMAEAAEAVVATGEPVRREVGDRAGRWHLMRALPKRGSGGRVEGVVTTCTDISANKSMEDELRRAKAYAESIVETLHEPLLVLDPQLVVRSANPAFYQKFGVEPQQTVGRRIYDLGNGQWDIPELRRLLEDVLPHDDAFSDYLVRHEFRHLGSRIMLLNGRRLDHVQLILLGIRDVTEEKKAEEALAREEARKAYLLGLSDALREERDPGALLDRAVAGLRDRIGADLVWYGEISREDGSLQVRQAALGSGAPDPRGSQDLHALDPEMARELGGGRTVVVSDAGPRPGGSPGAPGGEGGPRALLVVPLHREDDWVAALGVAGMEPRAWTDFEVDLAEETARRAWDALERARAQEALEVGEQRFRTMAHLVPDLLWRSDARGYVTWYNQRWLEYTGQSPRDAEGWGWTDVVHPADRERSVANYRRAAETGTSLEMEQRIRSRDGSYRWFLVRAEPVRNEQGEVQEWFGAATDVQEQRQAMEILEQRVIERTREVRALAGTLTVAEQEERRRISQILHDDLQQLLHGVQTKLALAQEWARRGDADALTAAMGGSLLLLDEAVRQTRQLTVDLSPPVLAGEGLTEALHWLASQMRELHQLSVAIRGDDSARVDSEELRVLLFQSVRELLFNVAKHGDTRQAHVDIGHEGGRLRVVVQDHGKGFDPSTMERARGALTGGFGLFNVRERLRLQGGDLLLDSAPGKGTRAVIYGPESEST